MKDNISTLRQQKVRERLLSKYASRLDELFTQMEGNEGPHQLESQLEMWSRQNGCDVLSEVVPLAQPSYAEEQLACQCGGTGYYQRQRAAQVVTMLGVVHYQRAYYVCDGCHQGWCPLDEELGWCAGSVSRGVQKSAALLGCQMPFRDAMSCMERLVGIVLSPATCQKLAEEVGAWMSEHANDPGEDTEPAPETPLYVSLDGTMAHERKNGWKEIRVGSVYTAHATTTGDIKADGHSYIVDHTSVESLGESLWEEFCRRDGKHAKQVVVIGDGATWIWNLARQYWPHAIHIVDWYHACSHLQNAAKSLAERRPDAAFWLECQKTALWEGRIHAVLDALHEVAWMSESLQEEETYFVRHQHCMRYDTYRQMELQIGSGSIESACKRVIGSRCKQAGMQWSSTRLTALASLRAIFLSGRFDTCFARCPPPTRTSLHSLVA